MIVVLQRYLSVIKLVSAIKDEYVKQYVLGILKRDKDFYDSLHEVSRNVVNGEIKLKKKSKKRLQEHKKTILSISKSKKCSKNRCKLVKQSGGHLPIILPALLSSLTAILAK